MCMLDMNGIESAQRKGHDCVGQVDLRPKYSTKFKAACSPYCPRSFPPSRLGRRTPRSLFSRPLADYMLRFGTWYSASRTQTAETTLIPLALNINHFGKSDKELVVGLVAAVPRRPLAYAMLLRMNFSHPTYPDSRTAPSDATLTISSRSLFLLFCLAPTSSSLWPTYPFAAPPH